ncbi:cold shock and DUF1294 domain-containing protein [Polaromonas sp. SM01]|uniref:cold shock and DUF1294 domain-containing protein n=1 Tax=Polaromonas sp. SM01 TaxID=3085630 RepID=UPI0029817769|nr:cold shock and DUF1294 domain-containing protein [Polaromonas sp. SM01]MDW5441656.1 cold shock and DUF1294 domain-containing protein [Polaromonas sp. SM01]
MRKQGSIVRWDAARGFGFIRSPASSADIFVHTRDCRGLALQEGMTVSFEEIHVGGKGPRATAVQSAIHAPRAGAPPIERRSRNTPVAQQRASRRPAAPATATPILPALLLMLAWAGLIAWGIWSRRLPMATPLIALLLNLATFFVYWLDKYAAQKGQWRTAENTLHLFSLLGGWPGAWFAQQVLRHKSSKASFRAAYRATVGLHGLALTGWLFREHLPNLSKLLPNL